MKKPFILLLTILLSACAADKPNTNSGNKPTTDPSTSATKTTEKITRVVALTSLSADIISNLDRTKLVGITGSKILANKSDLKELPRVAEGRTPPNLEKIIALKPDLVIGAKGMHDNVLNRLSATGIKTLTAEVNSWQALQALTKEIATLIQADPQPLLDRYTKMVATPAKLAGKTLILASDKPTISPNLNSWAGDLLTQLKIANASAELQGKSAFPGYVTLSAEKILQTNPDRILTIQTQPGDADKYKQNAFWGQLAAVKNNKVHTFDYYGLVNPGSIDAIEVAIKQLKSLN